MVPGTIALLQEYFVFRLLLQGGTFHVLVRIILFFARSSITKLGGCAGVLEWLHYNKNSDELYCLSSKKFDRTPEYLSLFSGS